MVHGRHEMGELDTLFWMYPAGHMLHPDGADWPGDDMALLVQLRIVFWSGQKALAGQSVHLELASST